MLTEEKVYEGVLRIPIAPDLQYMERVIENHFGESLQLRLLGAVSRYRRNNGILLDTDKARELSQIWNFSNMSRAVFCAAVHSPASAFIKYLYERTIRSRSRLKTVIFTAGGAGSGKSAANRFFAQEMTTEALVIYDTTLSNLKSAVYKLNLALENQKVVFIIYVYRPFGAAVHGVIQRAIQEGRTVPLAVLAHNHYAAPRTLLQIIGTFGDDRRVKVIAIDNSYSKVEDARIIDDESDVLNLLKIAAGCDIDTLLRLGNHILANEKKKGYIPDYILAALGC